MFITGQQVVCIDDTFSAWAKQHYAALPKEGTVYTVRGISPANDEKLNDDLAVYLVGLHNPASNVAPFREWGFKPERFRPLEELSTEDIMAVTRPLEVHAPVPANISPPFAPVQKSPSPSAFICVICGKNSLLNI